MTGNIIDESVVGLGLLLTFSLWNVTFFCSWCEIWTWLDICMFTKVSAWRISVEKSCKSQLMVATA